MARKFAAYIVVRGREPGVYREWADCQKQTSGVKNNCYRGCETLEEAVLAFRQLQAEGAVRAVPDDDFTDPGGPDDAAFGAVPVTPSAAARGARSARESAGPGRSTPASSASRARDAPARERAPPASTTRASTRGAQPHSEGLGARQARSAADERPPRAEMRREHARTERARTDQERPRGAARGDGGSQDVPSTPRRKPSARAASPVSVHTDDTEDDAPPPSTACSAGRRPVRSRRIVQDTASTVTNETHYDSVPQTPAWDESVSSPPARRSAPLSRSGTHTTSQSYETAPDEPQQDLPVWGSRSSSSASTSSSPPTSVSQYEDPQGRFSFHEFKRAEREEAKAARGKKNAEKAERNREDSQTEIIEIEDDDVDEVLLPRTAEASTHTPSPPVKSTTSQRSRTEASAGATRTRSPPTPTPRRLAKSRSVPTPAAEAPFSFTYRVCRGCGQPAPSPPLFGPEDAGAHCPRCFQPVARGGHTGPTPLRKSATHDGTSGSRRRVPPSDIASDLSEEAPRAGARPSGEARPKPDEGEDVFGMCGLSSALPRPTVIYPGEHDPRSPMNGPASLPGSSKVSFHRPSPTPSVDESLTESLRRSELIG